jgi:hypothetical protein
MTTLETRCLDAFPVWLRTLGDDARELASVLEKNHESERVRQRAAVALTYLFKSLDLIPDGLEDLGFIDDAFVFRVAAGSLASESGGDQGVIGRLAADAALVREFLGELYERLEAYVNHLEQSSARGRTVAEVLADPAKCAELVREARQWADGYEVPTFGRDEKNLVKLRSFLASKLRA